MLMYRQKPLDEKHQQKSRQHPEHGLRSVALLSQSMRQHVQKADPQHDAGHKTHGKLHRRMSQPHHQRKRATCQRGTQDEQTIDGKKPVSHEIRDWKRAGEGGGSYMTRCFSGIGLGGK